MAKYKVGDKVIIIDGSKISGYTGGWTIMMDQCIGWERPIREVVGKDRFGNTGYKLDGLGYTFDERGLKTTKYGDNVVVYRSGRDVIAKDPKTGKTAKATCSEEDVFDFCVGADIAIRRLMGKEIKKEQTKKIAVGDTVYVIDLGKVYTSYTTWHGLRNKYASHFVCQSQPRIYHKYEVVNVEPHGRDDVTLALIRNPETTQVFIVGCDGLRKA